jgi:putative ubiquitin-RnfH superfamily antitoxin RatB of RatAB toxin-antitoxin module
MALDDPGSIGVTVAYSPAAGQVDQVRLALPAGSTVAQAVAASGLTQRHPQAAQLPAGVWGRKAEPDAVLRDQDRVEIYRPLQCDPKEARRLRYRQRAQKAEGGAPPAE